MHMYISVLMEIFLYIGKLRDPDSKLILQRPDMPGEALQSSLEGNVESLLANYNMYKDTLEFESFSSRSER
jgi:hypothetical protein